MRRFIPKNISHIAVLYAAIIVLGLAVVFALIRTQEVQHHQDNALRSIMCFAEGFVEHSPHATAQQKMQAIQFYDEALSNAHLAPCSK